MESLNDKILNFLKVSVPSNTSGYGFGAGSGSGSSSASDIGYGLGGGSGSGSTFGTGYGAGSDFGSGSGLGNGYGAGDGSGCGSFTRDGYGDGSGYSIRIVTLSGQKIYYIDDVPTIITNVIGNLAKGYMIDIHSFKKTKCFIAKKDRFFAHGETAREAVANAMIKIY
jgi:hypothetical protein